MNAAPLVVVAGLALAGGGVAMARGGGRKQARRRLAAIRARRDGAGDAQSRRAGAIRVKERGPGLWARLQRKLDMTGKSWTVPRYLGVSAGLAAVCALVLAVRGLAPLTALAIGLAAGVALPYLWVARLATKRSARFVLRFPDALDLLVRGLRSGLPISESIGVVGTEVPDPVGTEFRGVSDRMKIGRTMDGALQDTADRLQTPEFQFFVISLAIQRETGGNLAETLGNLSDVLRKRMQMKLKVRAMASESKASAYIIGSLPFLVFAIIYWENPEYMSAFMTDRRLTYAALGGGVWMSIGAFIMAKMINFEI